MVSYSICDNIYPILRKGMEFHASLIVLTMIFARYENNTPLNEFYNVKFMSIYIEYVSKY